MNDFNLNEDSTNVYNIYIQCELIIIIRLTNMLKNDQIIKNM